MRDSIYKNPLDELLAIAQKNNHLEEALPSAIDPNPVIMEINPIQSQAIYWSEISRKFSKTVSYQSAFQVKLVSIENQAVNTFRSNQLVDGKKDDLCDLLLFIRELSQYSRTHPHLPHSTHQRMMSKGRDAAQIRRKIWTEKLLIREALRMSRAHELSHPRFEVDDWVANNIRYVAGDPDDTIEDESTYRVYDLLFEAACKRFDPTGILLQEIEKEPISTQDDMNDEQCVWIKKLKKAGISDKDIVIKEHCTAPITPLIKYYSAHQEECQQVHYTGYGSCNINEYINTPLIQVVAALRSQGYLSAEYRPIIPQLRTSLMSHADKILNSFHSTISLEPLLAIGEEQGEDFTRVDIPQTSSIQKFLEDATQLSRRETILGDFSLALIRAHPDIVRTEGLFSAKHQLYYDSDQDKMSTRFIPYPKGSLWGMKATPNQQSCVNAERLKNYIQVFFNSWGTLPKNQEAAAEEKED